MDVRLRGTLVESLDARLSPLPGEEVLELRGAYLAPGLIDCHVHLGLGGPASSSRERVLANARATLAKGVTAVRNLGNVLSSSAEELLAQLGPGEEGPRADAGGGLLPVVVSAGRALAPAGRYGTFLGREVQPDEAWGRVVDEEVRRGASVIKVMLSSTVDFATAMAEGPYLSLPELKEVVAAASSLGVPVACHANGSASIRLAAATGVQSVEHGILAREDDLQALEASGVAWVPTLTPLHNSAGDSRWPELAAIASAHARAVKRGSELGVRIFPGSDAGSPGVPHGSLLTELRLLAQAGVPHDWLASAAGAAGAALVGLTLGYGRLARGAHTDLVWFLADPFSSSSPEQRALGLVRGGRLATAPLGG